MAQAAPPGDPIPRPLPRGGRPTRSRDTRPRFELLDAVWMILFAALFLGVAFLMPGHRSLALPQLVTAMSTVVLTYLLGWRAAGRPAGIAAALLLATSTAFRAAASVSVLSDLFTLLSVGALFAFVAGSSLAALGLAALAVWIRPDGILLGLMLMMLSLIQHRRRALLGAALFLAPALGAWVFSFTTGHFPMPLRPFGFDPALFHWIATPAALVTAWFLLPFCGEYADPIRRARWLPVVLWTILLLALETVLRPVSVSSLSPAPAAFLPLWFALTGAGLARLLPVMTGDIPQPALRYVVATLAVLLLVGLQLRLEWPAR